MTTQIQVWSVPVPPDTPVLSHLSASFTGSTFGPFTTVPPPERKYLYPLVLYDYNYRTILQGIVLLVKRYIDISEFIYKY